MLPKELEHWVCLKTKYKTFKKLAKFKSDAVCIYLTTFDLNIKRRCFFASHILDLDLISTLMLFLGRFKGNRGPPVSPCDITRL